MGGISDNRLDDRVGLSRVHGEGSEKVFNYLDQTLINSRYSIW